MNETTRDLLTTIAENRPKIKEVGYNEGFSAGKKSEYDEFWDAFQNNGNHPTVSSYAFYGRWWNDITFNPKYDISVNVNNQAQLFAHSCITDLRGILERNGVKLIFGNGNFTNTFYNSKITRLPEMYMDINNVYGIFALCRDLKSIQKIILPDKNPNYMSGETMFKECTSLEEIEFEGVLYHSISFAYSPLSVTSLKNIITHLKDYSEDTANHNKYTVTFLSSAFEALEAEGNTSPNGNTWTEYIDDLKWNLELK